MKLPRTVFYCSYTDNNDEVPKMTRPFQTEKEARAEAKRLSTRGFWGAIERHHEFKQDSENDYGWQVDWEGTGDDAIEMLDYF